MVRLSGIFHEVDELLYITVIRYYLILLSSNAVGDDFLEVSGDIDARQLFRHATA